MWGEGAIKVQVGSGALAISKRTVSLFVLAHIFFFNYKTHCEYAHCEKGEPVQKAVRKAVACNPISCSHNPFLVTIRELEYTWSMQKYGGY